MIGEAVRELTLARKEVGVALDALAGGSRRGRGPCVRPRRRGAVRGPHGAGVVGVRPGRVRGR